MFLHSFLHIVSASCTVHSSELLSLNPQHISHNGLIRFPECHPNQSLRHSNQGSCQALKPIQRMQSVCKTLHVTMFYLWTIRIRYQLSKANTILKLVRSCFWSSISSLRIRSCTTIKQRWLVIISSWVEL